MLSFENCPTEKSFGAMRWGRRRRCAVLGLGAPAIQNRGAVADGGTRSTLVMHSSLDERTGHTHTYMVHYRASARFRVAECHRLSLLGPVLSDCQLSYFVFAFQVLEI